MLESHSRSHMHTALPFLVPVGLDIDAFATQSDRQPLNVYGSLYGGPNFAETNRSAAGMQSKLTVDEHFHTPSWLDGTDVSGMSEPDRVFDRATAQKRCHHTDVSITGKRDDEATLTSRCGQDFDEGVSMRDCIARFCAALGLR